MPVQVSKYSLRGGGGMVVMLIGLKIIQEAERHSLVAFMMRDGGKCAVGYISRSLHWSNSLSVSVSRVVASSFHSTATTNCQRTIRPSPSLPRVGGSREGKCRNRH